MQFNLSNFVETGGLQEVPQYDIGLGGLFFYYTTAKKKKKKEKHLKYSSVCLGEM